MGNPVAFIQIMFWYFFFSWKIHFCILSAVYYIAGFFCKHLVTIRKRKIIDMPLFGHVRIRPSKAEF